LELATVHYFVTMPQGPQHSKRRNVNNSSHAESDSHYHIEKISQKYQLDRWSKVRLGEPYRNQLAPRI
jgi:hypothetical protein